MINKLLPIAMALALPTITLANPVCVGIENDIERLACFDSYWSSPNSENLDPDKVFFEFKELAAGSIQIRSGGRDATRTQEFYFSRNDGGCSFVQVLTDHGNKPAMYRDTLNMVQSKEIELFTTYITALNLRDVEPDNSTVNASDNSYRVVLNRDGVLSAFHVEATAAPTIVEDEGTIGWEWPDGTDSLDEAMMLQTGTVVKQSQYSNRSGGLYLASVYYDDRQEIYDKFDQLVRSCQ